MLVETFEASSMENLKNSIQNWLDINSVKIINLAHSVERTNYSTWYNAIVIYEEVNEYEDEEDGKKIRLR